MIRLLTRRLLFALPMLFGVVTLTFFITHLRDPTLSLVPSYASPEEIAHVRELYGFDQPILQQYLTFLGKLARFDLGVSSVTNNPVITDLLQRLPSTLMLVLMSLGLALVIGIALGSFAAQRAGTGVDRVIQAGSFIVIALPEFWLALIAIYVFFFILGIAPAPTGQLGLADPQVPMVTGAAIIDSLFALNFVALKSALAHAVIPISVAALVTAAPLTRLMRSSTRAALQSDFVRFARTLGLPERDVKRYALRAALPPVITQAGGLFIVLLGGSIIMERIFSWGGLGAYAADAVQKSDYSAIQGFVLISGILSIVAFLVVDLLYVLIDRRVRL